MKVQSERKFLALKKAIQSSTKKDTGTYGQKHVPRFQIGVHGTANA